MMPGIIPAPPTSATKKRHERTSRPPVSNKNTAFKRVCRSELINLFLCLGAIKIKIPGNVNVVEGEKLRIVCMVFGKPAPEISWTVCK